MLVARVRTGSTATMGGEEETRKGGEGRERRRRLKWRRADASRQARRENERSAGGAHSRPFVTPLDFAISGVWKCFSALYCLLTIPLISAGLCELDRPDRDRAVRRTGYRGWAIPGRDTFTATRNAAPARPEYARKGVSLEKFSSVYFSVVWTACPAAHVCRQLVRMGRSDNSHGSFTAIGALDDATHLRRDSTQSNRSDAPSSILPTTPSPLARNATSRRSHCSSARNSMRRTRSQAARWSTSSDSFSTTTRTHPVGYSSAFDRRLPVPSTSVVCM